MRFTSHRICHCRIIDVTHTSLHNLNCVRSDFRKLDYIPVRRPYEVHHAFAPRSRAVHLRRPLRRMHQRYKRAARKYRRYSPHTIRVIGRLSDTEFVWVSAAFRGTATIRIRTSRCVADARNEFVTERNDDGHAAADTRSGIESATACDTDARTESATAFDAHTDFGADVGADRK